MQSDRVSDLLRHLRSLAARPGASGVSDGGLLGDFVERRDEAAFTELVRRHGPMVLAVCRSMLGNAHDAEDAFQATFLLLARKAATIRKPDSVANWLHGDYAARAASALMDRDTGTFPPCFAWLIADYGCRHMEALRGGLHALATSSSLCKNHRAVGRAIGTTG